MARSKSARPPLGDRVGRLRSFARRAALRLGAVALGLALALLVVELGLRIASLFVSGHREAAASAFVVCQGDSNTYGLHLPAEQAYPEQLEALLRLSRECADASVANLGVPGKTSWVVGSELVDDLERYHPAAVVVLIGVNDFSDRRPDPGGDGFFANLRTVKMARRLLAQWDAARSEPEKHRTQGKFDGYYEWRPDGGRELFVVDRTGRERSFTKLVAANDPERTQAELRDELVRIVELVRARGAVPILLSYPLDSGRLDLPRVAAREAAEATGARLVDPLGTFAEAQALVDLPRLVFEDKHPTALGYSILARLVANALAEEGLVRLERPFDPLEEVRGFVPPVLELSAWTEADALVGLRAHYAPGYRVQFVLSGTLGAGPFEWRGLLWPLEETTPGGRELPIAFDPLARVCLRRARRFIVPTDASGTAELRLDEDVARMASKRDELWASAVVIEPGQKVGAIADALRVR